MRKAKPARLGVPDPAEHKRRMHRIGAGWTFLVSRNLERVADCKNLGEDSVWSREIDKASAADGGS